MDLEGLNRKANEVLAQCEEVVRPIDPSRPLKIGGGQVAVLEVCECGRPTIAVVEYVLDGSTMFWRAACEDHARPIGAQVTVTLS